MKLGAERGPDAALARDLLAAALTDVAPSEVRARVFAAVDVALREAADTESPAGADSRAADLPAADLQGADASGAVGSTGSEADASAGLFSADAAPVTTLSGVFEKRRSSHEAASSNALGPSALGVEAAANGASLEDEGGVPCSPARADRNLVQRDVEHGGIAGEGIAGEGIAGEGIAGEGIAGEISAGRPLFGDPLAGEPVAGHPGDGASNRGAAISGPVSSLGAHFGAVSTSWPAGSGGSLPGLSSATVACVGGPHCYGGPMLGRRCHSTRAARVRSNAKTSPHHERLLLASSSLADDRAPDGGRAAFDRAAFDRAAFDRAGFDRAAFDRGVPGDPMLSGEPVRGVSSSSDPPGNDPPGSDPPSSDPPSSDSQSDSSVSAVASPLGGVVAPRRGASSALASKLLSPRRPAPDVEPASDLADRSAMIRDDIATGAWNLAQLAAAIVVGIVIGKAAHLLMGEDAAFVWGSEPDSSAGGLRAEPSRSSGALGASAASGELALSEEDARDESDVEASAVATQKPARQRGASRAGMRHAGRGASRGSRGSASPDAASAPASSASPSALCALAPAQRPESSHAASAVAAPASPLGAAPVACPPPSSSGLTSSFAGGLSAGGLSAEGSSAGGAFAAGVPGLVGMAPHVVGVSALPALLARRFAEPHELFPGRGAGDALAPVASADDWLGEQLAILSHAERSLLAGDPEGVVRSLDEYQARFPNGLLDPQMASIRQRVEERFTAFIFP